jgi:hypothetical protein
MQFFIYLYAELNSQWSIIMSARIQKINNNDDVDDNNSIHS